MCRREQIFHRMSSLCSGLQLVASVCSTANNLQPQLCSCRDPTERGISSPRFQSHEQRKCDCLCECVRIDPDHKWGFWQWLSRSAVQTPKEGPPMSMCGWFRRHISTLAGHGTGPPIHRARNEDVFLSWLLLVTISGNVLLLPARTRYWSKMMPKNRFLTC